MLAPLMAYFVLPALSSVSLQKRQRMRKAWKNVYVHTLGETMIYTGFVSNNHSWLHQGQNAVTVLCNAIEITKKFRTNITCKNKNKKRRKQSLTLWPHSTCIFWVCFFFSLGVLGDGDFYIYIFNILLLKLTVYKICLFSCIWTQIKIRKIIAKRKAWT